MKVEDPPKKNVKNSIRPRKRTFIFPSEKVIKKKSIMRSESKNSVVNSFIFEALGI